MLSACRRWTPTCALSSLCNRSFKPCANSVPLIDSTNAIELESNCYEMQHR